MPKAEKKSKRKAKQSLEDYLNSNWLLITNHDLIPVLDWIADNPKNAEVTEKTAKAVRGFRRKVLKGELGPFSSLQLDRDHPFVIAFLVWWRSVRFRGIGREVPKHEKIRY